MMGKFPSSFEHIYNLIAKSEYMLKLFVPDYDTKSKKSATEKNFFCQKDLIAEDIFHDHQFSA